MAFCPCTNSSPTELDQYDSILLPQYESNFDKRASPRFGRAAPRFGRGAGGLILSRIHHAGRYHYSDEDTNEFPRDVELRMVERRASPRFGRSIKFNLLK